MNRVVILGVQRLTGGCNRQVGGRTCPLYWAHPGILDIFSEYFLKIPRIYSNMLEYTRYFLVGVGVEASWARQAGEQAHKQPWS
jgi:hypothetical protein